MSDESPACPIEAPAEWKPLDLSEFEPQSMLEVRQTSVASARYPVIDVHAHMSFSAKVEKGVHSAAERQYIATPEELLPVINIWLKKRIVSMDPKRERKNLTVTGLKLRKARSLSTAMTPVPKLAYACEKGRTSSTRPAIRRPLTTDPNKFRSRSVNAARQALA